jgi:chromosomal replication initiator protein
MQAWEQFLLQQESELGQETVQKWLRTLKILRFDACNLYLEAKDSFQALWFEEHIRGKTRTSFINGNNRPIKIHLSTANAALEPKKREKANKVPHKSFDRFELTYDELDPHCAFQNFVVNPDNEMTYKFLCELAGISRFSTQSQDNFNPVYIYGLPGCGKTHLLMSLTHAFRQQGIKCLYVRAELFTDHVVKAIRAGEMSIFRQAYRNADILIVDDIHVFSRKGATQEEFFHTFNTLHLEGKQIILSANCSPQELQLIEPRLVSRFEWGLVLPLKIVPPEEYQNLLLAKSRALNFPLPKKIADFLLETFTSSPKALIKGLEALVLRLHLDTKHTLQNFSMLTAKNLLNDLILEEQKSTLTAQKIIQTVAEHYGIRTEDILGKSQTRECTLPRQIAIHLCRYKLKFPFMKIGDLFSRDHSTIMTSAKFIQKSLEANEREISNSWHAITKKLLT